MNRWVKISLITLGSILVLLIIAALGGWIWFNSQFLGFEEEYPERTEIKQITVDGYSFLDRNGNGALDPYEDDRLSTNERVEDVLNRMTIEEKIHVLKGSGLASAMGRGESREGIPGAVGTIVPTPRLGLPTIYLSDGPAGLRIEPKREGEERTYYCTAFPIATLLASTWNTALVEKVGDNMGDEALQYGIDVILGPGVNIHRHPLCGRNFEYYSEDPFLSGKMGAAMVKGIQGNGIGTSVKHFVVNNQETDRTKNDAILSERALREIYLKGFEIIVKEAQPWTIMSSYNKVNGTYTSESEFLLTEILRDEWDFEGLVMSDWFGGKDAVAQISAGNDLLEPGTNKQWNALKEGYENGTLTDQSIDESVRRILTLVFSTKKMQKHTIQNNPDLEAHANTTRQSAAEGMVLLKNEAALPLVGNENIALFGVTSYDFIAGGTGSGDVNEAYTISLEESLKNAGFEINQTAREIYEAHKASNPEAFVKPEGINAMFEPYTPPEITYSVEQLNEIVSTSGVAFITIGRNAGEGGDRVEEDDFLLTDTEQEMIRNVSEAFQSQRKKVIVVLNIGGVIETASWKSSPDGILLAWQGGQEGGNSVADIVSGKVNPSGKLPMTFPIALSDHASSENFPLEGGTMGIFDMLTGTKEVPEEEKVKNKDFTLYEEGVYVGYRHFDKAEKEVSYPFGFGLSYTEFEYSDLTLKMENDTVFINQTITNTGGKTGKEVVQAYFSKLDSKVDRPVQELKAFFKTKELLPGESIDIELFIPVNELSYWDEVTSSWVLEKGNYEIRVGTSSRDIRAVGEVEIL